MIRFLFLLLLPLTVLADTQDLPMPDPTYDCSSAMVILQAAGAGQSNLGAIICSSPQYPTGETLNCPWIRYESDALMSPDGLFVRQEACTANPVACPANSTPNADNTVCTCPFETHFWSFGTTPPTCESIVDPCISLTQDCGTTCGGADRVISSCSSAAGNLTAPYTCTCQDDEPEPEDLTDDPCDVLGGGVGCATSDMQDKQKAALDKITAEIDKGNIKLTDIKGVLQTSDGTLTDIKTLLTQIAASPGIVSAGGGGTGTGTGGTGTGGTGDGEEEGEGWTPPQGTGNGFGTRMAEVDALITTKKQELKNTIGGIKTSIFDTLSVNPEPSGVGGLPCWRGLALIGTQNFDICFSDFEDELSMIPMFIYGASLLLAALIILRPRGGDN
jgi:hypothetical protein